MVTAAPPKPPPPAPPPPNGQPPNRATSSPAIKRNFSVKSGITAEFEKTVIYGPGGIGKSELWSLLESVGVKPLCLDIGSSSTHINTTRIPSEEIPTFEDLRSAVQDESLWSGFDCIVIDDLTRAEEMASDWVCRHVKHEKGKPINSIEDYGFGKGLGHVYDAFLRLLSDLDNHIRNKRHVVCVAHECTAPVPNPGGDDFIRYEPRLQSPKSGKDSIRHRVKEWSDHLFFVGYDTFVNEDGKASGAGTRTIYPAERPTHWAKSRTIAQPIVYQKGDATLWRQLLNKGE
jgi:hypothetical protein